MPDFSLTIKVKDSFELVAITAAVEAYLGLGEERPTFNPDGFYQFLLPLLEDELADPESLYTKELVLFREDDAEMVVAKLREAASGIEKRLELIRAKRTGTEV